MPPLLSRKHPVPVAQRLDELRRPPAIAELRGEVLRTRGIFGGKRASHELPHGRIGALHEQTLKLNHDLNDPVGGRRAFRGQNAGFLQGSQ